MAEQTAACQPVYVHTYGMDRETWEKLFDRVAEAAHALDEEVSCSGGNACNLCEDPDWADLREMARDAGWSLEAWIPGQVHWGRRNPNGFIEHRHGWARVRRQSGHLVIHVYGPAAHEDLVSSARLVDPTPELVLTVARELRLGAS